MQNETVTCLNIVETECNWEMNALWSDRWQMNAQSTGRHRKIPSEIVWNEKITESDISFTWKTVVGRERQLHLQRRWINEVHAWRKLQQTQLALSFGQQKKELRIPIFQLVSQSVNLWLISPDVHVSNSQCWHHFRIVALALSFLYKSLQPVQLRSDNCWIRWHLLPNYSFKRLAKVSGLWTHYFAASQDPYPLFRYLHCWSKSYLTNDSNDYGKGVQESTVLPAEPPPTGWSCAEWCQTRGYPLSALSLDRRCRCGFFWQKTHESDGCGLCPGNEDLNCSLSADSVAVHFALPGKENLTFYMFIPVLYWVIVQ